MAKQSIKQHANIQPNQSALWMMVIGIILIIAAASAWILWPRQSYTDLMVRLDRRLLPLAQRLMTQTPAEAERLIEVEFIQLRAELVSTGYLKPDEPLLSTMNARWLEPNHTILVWDRNNRQFFYLMRCVGHEERRVAWRSEPITIHLLGEPHYPIHLTGSVHIPVFAATEPAYSVRQKAWVYSADWLLRFYLERVGFLPGPNQVPSFQEIKRRYRGVNNQELVQATKLYLLRRYWDERETEIARGISWHEVAYQDFRDYFFTHEVEHVHHPLTDPVLDEVLPSLTQFETGAPASFALYQLVSSWQDTGAVELATIGYQRALLLILDTYVREKATVARTIEDKKYLRETSRDWQKLPDLRLPLLEEFISEPDATMRALARKARARAEADLIH